MTEHYTREPCLALKPDELNFPTCCRLKHGHTGPHVGRAFATSKEGSGNGNLVRDTWWAEDCIEAEDGAA